MSARDVIAKFHSEAGQVGTRQYAIADHILYHLRAAGFVVARVPKKRAMPGAMGTEAAFDYASGWNACRTAMLEGDKP